VVRRDGGCRRPGEEGEGAGLGGHSDIQVGDVMRMVGRYDRQDKLGFQGVNNLGSTLLRQVSLMSALENPQMRA
jgi:hypothetical protein